MAKDPIPSRVQIKTALTVNRVNNYWRTLNMAEETWMKNFTLAQRYEAVITDLLNKLAQAEETLKDGK
ncbi:MAG: hypothetical protein HC771_21240 [Synechococcales cyanobacterium CRU_2_2]|nr:hypothetical protein [Synechococcales cyanobacterium CRU_2_2]